MLAFRWAPTTRERFQMPESKPSTTSFTNTITGKAWGETGEVFALMCPMTQKNCHSLCACFKENRTTTGYRGTPEDIAFRVDGHAFGQCELFEFYIGAYRD